jgi:hypothetical protein
MCNEDVVNELKEKRLPTFGTAQERKDRLKKHYGNTLHHSSSRHHTTWRGRKRNAGCSYAIVDVGCESASDWDSLIDPSIVLTVIEEGLVS